MQIPLWSSYQSKTQSENIFFLLLLLLCGTGAQSIALLFLVEVHFDFTVRERQTERERMADFIFTVSEFTAAGLQNTCAGG